MINMKTVRDLILTSIRAEQRIGYRNFFAEITFSLFFFASFPLHCLPYDLSLLRHDDRIIVRTNFSLVFLCLSVETL
jgi:hypothetical protein